MRGRPMLELLCFLLYLSAIVSPGSYYQADIDAAELDNASEIQAIESDQGLANTIIQDYSDDTQWITIIDGTGH